MSKNDGTTKSALRGLTLKVREPAFAPSPADRAAGGADSSGAAATTSSDASTECTAESSVSISADRTILSMPIDASKTSDDFVDLVPIDLARDHLVISQGIDEQGAEILAVSGRDGDQIIAHNIGVRIGRTVVMVNADGEAIARALDAMSQRSCESMVSGSKSQARDGLGELNNLIDMDEESVVALLAADERDLLKTAGRSPVVKLVSGLLFEAISRRASDVHVQGATDAMIVRYRIDGVLIEARRLPKSLLGPVVSRIKVMSHMDIAEKRLPQDGRCAVAIGDSEIDLRVSSLPTASGERVVIRLLDKRQSDFFEFEKLGMPSAVRRRFETICARPQGIVLVTGPTGSGKTTTLYSALKALNSDELNVMTLEDPIEYELEGVSQSQINLKKGVTFATSLRHLLRQDPDVIMVGEIRDAETARIAIQASLTGHLVFSTLHTNSASSAVTRLVDLGVEPYLINASLAAVLAQRLVRTVCVRCDGAGQMGPAHDVCPTCLGAGLSGRLGLFELLVMDDAIRELVAAGAGIRQIEGAAQKNGMATLRTAGLDAAQRGLTTRTEVDRITLIDEDEVIERERA